MGQVGAGVLLRTAASPASARKPARPAVVPALVVRITGRDGGMGLEQRRGGRRRDHVHGAVTLGAAGPAAGGEDHVAEERGLDDEGPPAPCSPLTAPH